MSVTDDGIPHGLEGYRKFGCKCDDGTVRSCQGANREYHRKRREAKRVVKDELAAKRAKRSVQCSTSARSSQDDSVPKAKQAKRLGEMEQAVVDAATKLGALEDKPDIVMMARNMARILDNPKQVALHPSTNRQLMALMAQLRGTDNTGKRKSRGRLATVQRMTKSKRAVAQ